VTTFSSADGFVRIDRHEELVEAGSEVEVQLISRDTKPVDLVIIGSHCAGLDILLSLLKTKGIQVRFMSVGSSAGLQAVKRGQCDIAGMHLFDPETETYNQPFLTDNIKLVKGYRRKQGLVFRKNDGRFQGSDAREIIDKIKIDPSCRMINRNLGSGTRILIDQLLDGVQPPGYVVQTGNHRAVIAAIQQQRADWGIVIEAVVDDDGLVFLPIQDECYDFIVSDVSLQKASVQAFMSLLKDKQVQKQLAETRLGVDSSFGELVS
jgi:putative molybdopterin biosynthesis protein